MFLELLLCEPELVEGSERGQNGPTDPSCVSALIRGCWDLDTNTPKGGHSVEICVEALRETGDRGTTATEHHRSDYRGTEVHVTTLHSPLDHIRKANNQVGRIGSSFGHDLVALLVFGSGVPVLVGLEENFAEPETVKAEIAIETGGEFKVLWRTKGHFGLVGDSGLAHLDDGFFQVFQETALVEGMEGRGDGWDGLSGEFRIGTEVDWLLLSNFDGQDRNGLFSKAIFFQHSFALCRKGVSTEASLP